jgi:MFS family permease
MYLVVIRELFPMRSDGLGRALACIFAGLFCGSIGQMIGGLLAFFLFVPSLVPAGFRWHARQDRHLGVGAFSIVWMGRRCALPDAAR